MKLQEDIPVLCNKTVVFFDGVCNLCNGIVQFIIKRDKKKRFYFASLQSDTGRSLLAALPSQYRQTDSILLYKNGTIYKESTAALKVLAALPGLWGFTSLFLAFPAFLRDPVYRWVARNRYSWFGKRDECMIPSPGMRERFIG